MRSRDIERVLYQALVNVVVWIVSNIAPPDDINWLTSPYDKDAQKRHRRYMWRTIAFIPLIVALTPIIMLLASPKE